MTTTEDLKQEEKRARALSTLRRMVADKREFEKKAIEKYGSDPELQQLITKLRHENADRGTAAKL